jgi:hypothetical protein
MDIFGFIVRYFGFLKRIPLMPHIFDALLRLWCLITHTEILDCMDDIEAEVLSWPGTTACMHRFGGVQYNVNGREIGHIHSNGLLDILFSRKIKNELLGEGRLQDHHIFTKSGWISFYVCNHQDTAYAVSLLKRSYKRFLATA